ncbi:MAG: PTS sugar transporter subunit IIA, partial [Pseudomonadota bacterium]
VAIPHGKLPDIDRIYGLLARFEKPIDFDALDEQPVDIAFLLLAPEGAGTDHLKALAKIARVLRNGEVVQKIRATSDKAALYSLVTAPPDDVTSSDAA